VAELSVGLVDQLHLHFEQFFYELSLGTNGLIYKNLINLRFGQG